jgi:ABC-type lipoprotein release transport system permease subunit
MAGAWLWVRREWLARWRALLALGLLIAVVGGVTLAVVGGARRTATAFGRFEAATNAFRVNVELRQPSNAGEMRSLIRDLPTPDQLADQISAVDGVDGVSVFSYVAATPDPRGDLFAFAYGAGRGAAPNGRLVRGRQPRPDAPYEVGVNRAAVEAWGADVGDELELRTLAPDQLETFMGLDDAAPRGPTVKVKVVGVWRDIEDISDLPEPVFVAGPGFVPRWGDQVISATGNALVKVDGSRVDSTVDALNRSIDPRYEASRASDSDDFAGRVRDTIDVEVAVLSVFAVAAALAGLVVIAQALARTVGGSPSDHGSLRALGMTSVDAIGATSASMLPAVAIGVFGSLLLAVALSPIFPRGLARLAEPAPGVRLDSAVLLLGGATLVLLLVALIVLVSWWIIGRTATAERHRGPGLVSRLAASFPPVPALGMRFALERERRSGLVGGFAGIVGAAILVGGIVSVATVSRSRDELLGNSALYGARWDLGVEFDGQDTEPVLETLDADPDVQAVGIRQQLLADNGQIEVEGPGGSATAEPKAFQPVRGTIAPVVSGGRPPDAGEAAIGRRLADRLGASIGDTVVVHGHGGDLPLAITGWFINAGDDDVDLGMLVTPDSLDALRKQDCPADSEDYACYLDAEGAGVVLQDGADLDQAEARLQAVVPDLERVGPPSTVENLGEMGNTPWLLAAFLALVGGAGLAHALIIGVRRRRYDLAVVRAIGLRPAEGRRVVGWQAFVMAAVGAAVGLLAGAIAGRLIWSRVVVGIGAVVKSVVPVAVVVGAPLIAIGLALLLSVLAGHRVSGLQLAQALRTE